MPDLIPFAVTHIGVSVALAAMLILMHPRLHRADFLLYLGDVLACHRRKPGGKPRGTPFASDVLTGRAIEWWRRPTEWWR
jgi:hypothetical protein